MLTGNKNDILKLIPYVSPRLAQALAYIAATDFSKVPNGEYEIDGRRVFARVNTYDTEPKAERRPEKHNQYIDVQYVAEGSETIWFTPLTEACVETENRAEKDDVIFYEDPKEKNCAVLNAGDFAIFFPWELHRPNCSNGCCGEAAPQHVQKIVVKVEA
ncbi:MAG: YhcH/YjgK/YiaL family protein [Phascolarctobacterium sp.]|nr:YhcH/YjgK/YiaL family protein [Phascolarctobacterium sp.]